MTAGIFSELVEVRDDSMNCEGFTKNDVCIFTFVPPDFFL